MALSDAYAYIAAGWTLDESSGTRVDSIGSNDLTDNNTVASATGQFSNAADFEADNTEFLSCASSADLQGGDVDFMLRGWMKLESQAGGSPGRYLIVKSAGIDNPTVLEYSLHVDHPFHGLRFSVCDTSNNIGYVSTGTDTIAVDTWYLFHAWHDSVNNEIGVVLNAGTPVTAAWTSGVRTTGNGFRLGAGHLDLVSTYGLYDGLLDDVCILRGYLLNSSERTADYNGGTGVAFSSWAAAATKAPPSFRRPARFFRRAI